MPRAATPLTDLKIRKAKPEDFPLWDGLGLYLQLSPTGSRLWRFKYHRPDGRENRLGLGAYPEVSLAEAREIRERYRRLLREGTDPARLKEEARRRAAQERDGLFETVAAAWLEAQRVHWAADTYRKAAYLFSRFLIPSLKGIPISALTSQQAVKAIRLIELQAPSLAGKARGYLVAIQGRAVQEGLREDGKPLNLSGSLQRRKKGHIPAAVDIADVATVVRKVRAYPSPVTRAALELTMLTGMRPGVVVSATWDEIDFKRAEWGVSGERMKTRHAHISPLPRQAIALLREMEAMRGVRPYVFPPVAAQKTPHLNRDALSNALRRMGLGGTHATHGFRGMLRTVGRERLDIPADVLEAQLAHAKQGDVQKAYDRTQFLSQRHVAMQRYADYLDTLAAQSP